VLARGLTAPIGDRVAFTLSSKKGVVVRIGAGGVAHSFGAGKEGFFEEPLPPLFELRIPSPSLVIGGINISSGICCAVVSSTKIRRTFRASLPKLKKEKKYYCTISQK
jgi:hypothetical protein